MSFTKYSALQNPLTNGNNSFSKDYYSSYLYNKSGKSHYLHEHMIFISNHFINKISKSEHIYIDGTFLYPSGFIRLIVILYREENTGTIYPGLYALINNKKFEGYKIFFYRIKNILTIENSIELNLKSYSIDFEKALIEVTNLIFNNIWKVGCFYHYCRNIREKAFEYGLFKDIKKYWRKYFERIL